MEGSDEANRDAIEHGFRTPARRRKPIYVAAAAVFVVVAVLVYLMARPDSERLAASFVDAALAALPEKAVSASDLRAAVANLQSAFDVAPQHAGARDARRALQERVARQLAEDIARGELENAEALIAAANQAWPDAPDFDTAGPLRHRLDKALEARALQAEVRSLLARAKRQLDGSDQSMDALTDALGQLRAALDAASEGRDSAVPMDVRREIVNASRESLQASDPQHAQRLLDTLAIDSGDDAEVNGLREEVNAQLAELNRATQLEGLIARAEESLRADRLTTPLGNNAMEYFQRVLALDPGNARAAAGVEAVAERYAVLIGNAVENGHLPRARRHLASLRQISPAHPRIDEFGMRIEKAVLAESQAAQTASLEPAVQPAAGTPVAPAEPLPDDPEGRLWYTVRDGCDQKEIRRYIDTYPEGRYIDQAWQRISDCLATP